jgi:hypothetical protein
VVMFTFVNALRDIAAGNFVSMFQLTEFFSFSTENLGSLLEGNAGAAAADAIGYLATSYITILFMMGVLAVLTLLAIVFIYRIVIIWVFVILSPAAFFLGGIKSTVPRAAGPYGQWWEKIIGAVALGPILTFFLWLAMAAAADGSIASSEGFPTDGTEDVPTFLSSALEIEPLLSLFLAAVLIMAGFQAASSSASALGGFAGKMINEGTGKAIVKNAAMLPMTAGYRAGKAGVKFGGRQVLGRTQIGQQVGQSIQRAGNALEESGVVGGRAAGRMVRGLGGKVESGSDAVVAKAREVGAEKAAGKSRRERANDMLHVGDPTDDTFLLSDRYEQEANFKDLLTDKKMRSEMRSVSEERAKTQAHGEGLTGDDFTDRVSELTEESYGEKMDQAIKWGDKNGDVLGDKKAEFTKAKAGHLRYLGEDEIDEVLSDPDFKRSSLSAEDMSDPKVLAALSGRVEREFYDKNNNLVQETLLDQVSQGKGVDSKVRDAAQGKGRSFDDLGTTGQDNSASIGQALKNGHLKVNEITVDHLSDDSGALDTAKITEIAQAMSHSGVDLGDLAGLDTAFKTAIQVELAGMAGVATGDDLVKAQQALLSADDDPDAAQRVLSLAPGAAMSGGQRDVVVKMMLEQPTQAFKLDAHISAGTGSTEMTKLVESQVNGSTADNLKNLFARSQSDPQGAALQGRIRESVLSIQTALSREVESAVADMVGGGMLDRDARKAVESTLKSKYKKFNQLERYTRPPPTP